jgi:MerR family redox-sensitive transcriptional activator SoxR
MLKVEVNFKSSPPSGAGRSPGQKMTIGDVAKQAGLRPSALRYYERLGLIRAPARRGGRRDYGPEALGEIAVVQAARACGFTLEETLQLVRGFPPRTPASARWNLLADRKQHELDLVIARAQAMKDLLHRISRCQCSTLTECGQRLRKRRSV